MSRLRQAQTRYGFQIVEVEMLHPLQGAPVVVIRSDNKQAISRATPAIVNLFDPRHVTSGNPSGYAYEGYFSEAQDANGVPYLATFNHWRAPHVGGGEWAADGTLYPFAHWIGRAARLRRLAGAPLPLRLVCQASGSPYDDRAPARRHRR